jgi:NADH:ubiquinone oxidoreductase subunit 2 (subunit N)
MQGRDIADNFFALRQRIVGRMIAYSPVARSK